MRIIDKKEIILEYGKDTDNIELLEFREGIEIRINGKRIQLMRGDAASVISKILSSSVAVSVLFISITLN
jgi:hypothetical protein